MVNFPKRASEIPVEVDEGSTIYVKPMSDPQASAALSQLKEHIDDFDGLSGVPATIQEKGGGVYQVVRGGEVLEDSVRGKQNAMDRAEEINEEAGVDVTRIAISELEAIAPLMGIFDKNVIRADGVEIGDEPFNAQNDNHIDSIPLSVKALAVGEMLDEVFMREETGKG